MKKYSAFAVAREALRDHLGWEGLGVHPNLKRNMMLLLLVLVGMVCHCILPWQKLWHYKCGYSGEGLARRR